MNGIPVRKFYGVQTVEDKPKVKPSESLQLLADTFATKIFQSLRFPVREKSSKTIRAQIALKDKAVLCKLRDVDELLRHGSNYHIRWYERIMNIDGDTNVVVRSTLRLRKIRAEQAYARTAEQEIKAQTKHHGFELVVKLTRARRVGDREACRL